eukprot:TRINITY_DN98399_c0_g1_i1.p1 TRINITY_DN98399_c0_g1~~TRINITY_DN98399_c0_g1_i1.p1  ORF type:complete len:368 (-),score=75.50 TRINITY_DN98399_c0_g1_i1:179-1282(-)
MPRPTSVRDSTEILKLQLELQEEILRNQQRSVELQAQLIKALLPDDQRKSAGDQPAEADLLPSGEGIVEQQGDEDKEQPTRELEEFLQQYDVEPEGIPWLVAPSLASFRDILKLSMYRHPGDLAVCFPDRSAFFEAAEAAMGPSRFRDFLVTSLELRLLFQALLLSITVPASLSQPTPKTTLDLVISVFTFLLGVLNTIGVCLCIFATGILSSVSKKNFTAWLHANYKFVHAALSSQCAMVPMVLFLQVASQIRTQLSVDWLGTSTQNALCCIQVAMIMCMMTAMLFATNAAGRTAAFSGAMGHASVPSKTSIFRSTVGGDKVGLLGMKEYLKAVMDNGAAPSVKKKSMLRKATTKIDIGIFDAAVF